MNKKEFTDFMHHPELLNKEDGLALEELVNDFPWFQAAQQLLLKAYQNKDNYHFDRQLPVTSLLHGDRTLLFEYLKEDLIKEFSETAITDLESFESVMIERRRMTHHLSGTETDNETIPPEAEALAPINQERDTQEQLVTPQEHSDLADEISVVDTELTDLPDSGTNDASEDLHETFIPEPEAVNVPAISSVSDDEDLPFADFQRKYMNSIPETEITVTDENESSGLADEPETVEKENNIKEAVVSEKTEEPVENIDFYSWLNHKTRHGKLVDQHEKPKEEAPLPMPPIEEAVETPKEKRLRKFNSLIDKFIENNPSISKPEPAKFYNPAEKAKESITENFDLVTETLARIYIKQGNYKKAILVYEKLMLLYPGKQDYFESEISKLKDLQ
jgi:hypothetical protein